MLETVVLHNSFVETVMHFTSKDSQMNRNVFEIEIFCNISLELVILFFLLWKKLMF